MINYKGQAAITDALLFLSIVGVISTLIVTSAMNYGVDIVSGIRSDYETSYLYSAMKTIYSVNHGRDGKSVLQSDSRDYVMTVVKEQYSYAGKINSKTKVGLFKSLDQIFAPFPQKSYMISIYADEVTIINPIFIGLRLGSSSMNNYYLDCVPSEGYTTSISNFLQNHSLDLRFTTSEAIFFKGILATKPVDGSSAVSPSRQEGGVVLAYWNSIDDLNEELLDRIDRHDTINIDSLDCNSIQVYDTT